MATENFAADCPPVSTLDDCIAYFRQCVSAPTQLRVGLEYELILVDRLTTMSIPFYGARSLSCILAELMRQGYQPIHDAGRVVGLTRVQTSITLEPGGQLEFSGSPLASPHAVRQELEQFLSSLRGICDQLAIAIVPIGYRPFGTAASVHTIPRARYAMLMPQLLRNGGSSTGQKMTASMQVSLNYLSERHAGRVLQLGLKSQPFVVAMCGNSPLFNGQLSAWKSYRMHTWSNFDLNRSGVPAFMLAPAFEYDAFLQYAKWALSRPLLFISRQGRLIEIETKTFAEFMRHGHAGWHATRHDWIAHLGTIFPEARLKNVIELRSADTCSPALAAALVAFWKGLSYDGATLEAALERLAGYDAPYVQALYAKASVKGLAASCGEGQVFSQVAAELLALAAAGLARQGAGTEELACLNPLMEAVEQGLSPADQIIGQLRQGEAVLDRLAF